LDDGISWILSSHSVLIIGYGADRETGTPYWIVRNNYSKRWGDGGHFLIRRG
jgi:C1A family cysteine protease